MKKMHYVIGLVSLSVLLTGCGKESELLPEDPTNEEEVVSAKEEHIKENLKEVVLDETSYLPEEETKEEEGTKEKEKLEEKPTVRVFLNQKEMNYGVKPIEKEDDILVPLRETAEALNWHVTWNRNRFVVLHDKNTTLRFKIGEKKLIKEDTVYPTKRGFLLASGNVFIPMEDVANAMGLNVSYNKKEKVFQVDDHRPAMESINEVTIPVIVYHGVKENGNDTLFVSPNAFKDQMNALKEAGYTTITDHDLLLYLNKEKNLPKKPVLIHFDDGYESVYQYAYPVLKEKQMQATIFLVGKTVKEKTGDKEIYQTSHLSWEQVKEMYTSGYIDFQSHTFNAHTQNGVLDKLKNESDEAYRARLFNDFVQSKELIEKRIKNKVVSIAYPVGLYDDTSIQSVKKAGYNMAFSMNGGKVKWGDSLYALNRIYVSGSDTGQGLLSKIGN